jgi:hypothetical protein
MREIHFPGNHKQPCRARYHVVLDQQISDTFPHAHILVHQGQHDFGTALTVDDQSRDNVLNRLLTRELEGVRLEFIRFSYLLESPTYGVIAYSYPIHLDINDYVAKGNPHTTRPVKKGLLGRASDQEITYLSINVTAGCAHVFTLCDEAHQHSREETARLLTLFKRETAQPLNDDISVTS